MGETPYQRPAQLPHLEVYYGLLRDLERTDSSGPLAGAPVSFGRGRETQIYLLSAQVCRLLFDLWRKLGEEESQIALSSSPFFGKFEQDLFKGEGIMPAVEPKDHKYWRERNPSSFSRHSETPPLIFFRADRKESPILFEINKRRGFSALRQLERLARGANEGLRKGIEDEILQIDGRRETLIKIIDDRFPKKK